MGVKYIERVPLIEFHELDDDDKSEYREYYEDSRFFEYRGTVYCLGEVMRLNGCGWNGNLTLTNTSALLVKLTDDYDYIIVGLAS